MGCSSRAEQKSLQLFFVLQPSLFAGGDVIAQAAGVYREKRENERQMKLVESVKKKRTKKKKSSIIISIPKSSDMVIYADGFGSVCVRAYVVLLCQQKRIRDI